LPQTNLTEISQQGEKQIGRGNLTDTGQTLKNNRNPLLFFPSEARLKTAESRTIPLA